MQTVSPSEDLRSIALLGNPNTGKSSLFNVLTGLNQKVGNFPGVTVERKKGYCKLPDGSEISVLDIPGVYSLFARSDDERVVSECLLNPENPDYPQVLILVLDASNLRRSLLLYLQAQDLGMSILPVISMLDIAENQGQHLDPEALAKALGQAPIRINPRKGDGVRELKEALTAKVYKKNAQTNNKAEDIEKVQLCESLSLSTSFQADLLLFQYKHLRFLNEVSNKDKRKLLHEFALKKDLKPVQIQAEDTYVRSHRIDGILDSVFPKDNLGIENLPTESKVDGIFLHRFWGLGIFFGILLLIFQAVFKFAEYPMDLIDAGFAMLVSSVSEALPPGVFTDLLTEGILAGIGGVVIFIPQIAILFAFVAVLEETGYMSRAVFLTDRLMRYFGLNGKSIVPLISGMACAIPAVIVARSIENPKERLITVFVTPFMSCSARLPVYAVIIALIIPSQTVLGFLSLQGLVLTGLYLLGFAAALFSAFVMQKILRTEVKEDVFITELPDYKMPRFGNVGITVWNKVKAFLIEAGRIILTISVILWVLASYGPGNSLEEAAAKAEKNYTETMKVSKEDHIASARLEASYIGRIGKFTEPVVTPLGYDWKIGIALISSFAAREVFVGTMATIYSIGSESESDETLRERMQKERNPLTGKERYDLPTGISLLLFYAFALQCMSTIAVVYKETGSVKWTLTQWFYMTGLAYLSAFAAYQWLS